MKQHTLYMVEVTEHEYEAGWGASTRPDGKAFCEDRDYLEKFFQKRLKTNQENNTSSYSLYETVSKPKLVRVSDKGFKYFNRLTLEGKNSVLWLDGDVLKEFMKEVEL